MFSEMMSSLMSCLQFRNKSNVLTKTDKGSGNSTTHDGHRHIYLDDSQVHSNQHIYDVVLCGTLLHTVLIYFVLNSHYLFRSLSQL